MRGINNLDNYQLRHIFEEIQMFKSNFNYLFSSYFHGMGQRGGWFIKGRLANRTKIVAYLREPRWTSFLSLILQPLAFFFLLSLLSLYRSQWHSWIYGWTSYFNVLHVLYQQREIYHRFSNGDGFQTQILCSILAIRLKTMPNKIDHGPWWMKTSFLSKSHKIIPWDGYDLILALIAWLTSFL